MGSGRGKKEKKERMVLCYCHIPYPSGCGNYKDRYLKKLGKKEIRRERRGGESIIKFGIIRTKKMDNGFG